MDQFGERLRSLRGSRSKSEFARELGLANPQTYHRYEEGRIPDGETLVLIANQTGVTVDWLLGRTDERNPKAASVVREPSASYGSDVPEEIKQASSEDLIDSLVDLISQVKEAKTVTRRMLLRTIRQVVQELERRGA